MDLDERSRRKSALESRNSWGSCAANAEAVSSSSPCSRCGSSTWSRLAVSLGKQYIWAAVALDLERNANKRPSPRPTTFQPSQKGNLSDANTDAG